MLKYNQLDDLCNQYCKNNRPYERNSMNDNIKKYFEKKQEEGILVGTTRISNINIETKKSQLYYRGIDIDSLIDNNDNYGFEEAAYLLLIGKLPTKDELITFVDIISELRELPQSLIDNCITNNPSKNVINNLQKTIISLYNYDTNAEDNGIENVFKQSLNIIAKIPIIAICSYFASSSKDVNELLKLLNTKKNMSTAEMILYMLKGKNNYTALEVKTLDAMLLLHLDHGGGNNSTFTNCVVTTSFTDTYSAVVSSLSSLKGSRHGGANLKARKMITDLRETCHDNNNQVTIKKYLTKVLNKEAFDKSGIIYGIGHTVYKHTDPREVIMKKYGQLLAKEKGLIEEYNLYDMAEKAAIELLSLKESTTKSICANIDFYSGFIYSMLDIPEELYISMFATSRIVGWSAHRMEVLLNKDKLIRPIYRYIGDTKEYIRIENR